MAGADLSEYAAKRDFGKTPEPRVGRGAGQKGRLAFVVQKHDARRLHYDFRLEWQGVLLSWAVTKGPSPVPGTKRLAVRTEDHPLAYGKFEGTIPAGEYGGGTVMLWDRGWWEPQGDFARDFAKGNAKVVLHGERMKGKWVLVRMRTEGEKRENWLLIKEHDAFVEKDDETLVDRFATSVSTGRSMEEIAGGGKARRPARSGAAKPRKPSHSLPSPAFRPPQLARLSDEVPEGEDWLHETKFDGYRCLAAVGKDGVKLYTRSGLDWTRRYQRLPEAFDLLKCRNALVDGEVVATAPEGSAFSSLQKALEDGGPLQFMAFDLLELDGKDLTGRPLIERKAKLEKLIATLPPGQPIDFAQHIVGHGRAAFDSVTQAGGEGIVSKRAESRYRGTREGSWLKIKASKRQEFVVGGWYPSETRSRPFSSLLLGTREGGGLRYRGRVGSGFDDESLSRVFALLEARARKGSPFEAVPANIARKARWVRPDLVVEVEYAELTSDGNIRHGVFQGVREDKEAEVVTLEREGREDGAREVLCVRISHPERMVFPEKKITKGEVAEYYAAAAERMIVLAGSRPVSLLRCPDGRAGECFFQKHAGKGFPRQIGSVDIEESSGKIEAYMVIARPEGFVAAAQMGALEFHIWGSRRDRLEKPDRLVFDLDPDEGVSFDVVKAAARELRELLNKLGLETVPMVTGGKGVHVIVPLRRTAEWEAVKIFARMIAEHLAARAPERYVATMSKAKRKDRIFIDWLRNDRGATAVAPYSLRAREGGPVAVPLTWNELGRVKSANQFSLAEARKRLAGPCPLLEAPAGRAISAAVVGRMEKLLREDR